MFFWFYSTLPHPMSKYTIEQLHAMLENWKLENVVANFLFVCCLFETVEVRLFISFVIFAILLSMVFRRIDFHISHDISRFAFWWNSKVQNAMLPLRDIFSYLIYKNMKSRTTDFLVIICSVCVDLFLY